MIFKGRILKDEQTLTEAKLENGVTVVLVQSSESKTGGAAPTSTTSAPKTETSSGGAGGLGGLPIPSGFGGMPGMPGMPGMGGMGGARQPHDAGRYTKSQPKSPNSSIQ